MIEVRKGEQTFPFSEGIMAKSLTGAGLPVEDAYRIVRQIRSELRESEKGEVTSNRLRDLVSQKLLDAGREYEERFYRVRRRIKYLSEPVFILIGGATGVGKSTIAAEIGHRLGINRVIGTDTIREIMRSIISRNLIPTLHESTFEAMEALRTEDIEHRLIYAFQEQARLVTEGVAAVVRRGAKEGLHMVLNGVHIVPGLLDRILDQTPRHFFQFMLSVSEPEHHKMFFYEREKASRRAADRYVESLGRIRRVQDFLLSQAKKYDVRIVENEEYENTLKTIQEDVIAGFWEEVDHA